jgi:formylglycine-generating enzyme required for sulfatase activity
MPAQGFTTVTKESRPKEPTAWTGWPKDAPAPAIAPFDAANAKTHQEAWAKHLGVPVEYTNSIGMKFMLIPPGEFTMGCTQAEIDLIKLQEGNKDMQAIQRQELAQSMPSHRVTITRPFYIQTHEVTNGIYQKILGKLPEMNDPAKPEMSVTWNVTLVDAAAFCDELSRKEGKTPAHRLVRGKPQRTLNTNGYRLPTEAEWEYVCRAGTTTLWFFGNISSTTHTSAILKEYQTFHQGAAAKPNPFGMFDMYGGSSEWCFDRFMPYQPNTVVDPFTEPEDGEGVVRGGSYFSLGGTDLTKINSIARIRGDSGGYVGFGRVVLPIEMKPAKATP